MNVFFDLVAQAMAVIYAFTNNYALTIIGLTLIIMIIVTPLTLKGTRSMMVMQQLQPEMKKIQTQYKDDRQKLNEELLKFYKENDISPLGGCLPLLVQMPVFIVLYQVLRGLTRRASGMGFDFGWIGGQLGSGTGTSKPPTIDRVFDPAFLKHNTQMYIDLSHSNTMQAYGLDLAQSASKALSTQGLVTALPYLFLIAIVAVTGFVQQRQIQGRNPNQQVNPQQQMIMKIMPVFLPVISFGLPSGLVLYFAVSNLFRVGQQWFISRSIYGIKRGDLPPPAPEPADTTPPVGFFASLKQAVSPNAAEPADSAKTGKTPTKGSTGKAAAAKGGSKASSAKAGGNGSTTGGRTSGRVTPSKSTTAKSSSASGSAKSDTGKSDEASKPSSSKGRRSGANGDSGTTGDAPRSSRRASSTGGDEAKPGPAPTLQPRARKNKKR